MKKELVEACGKEPPEPLFKLFNPVGSATWLVCSMEPDGDTLWVVADLGMGCVEFGTASLSELESIRGPLGLGIERDTSFDGTDYSVEELIKMESLTGKL